MKDLIQQATTFAESGASFTGAEVRLWVGKLTDALERLTAGDVALPEPTIEFMSGHREPVEIYDAADIIDYGNRRAAAAVLTLEKDAALGKVAMQFVDRAGDVHPGIDDAETICADFYKAMVAELHKGTP